LNKIKESELFPFFQKDFLENIFEEPLLKILIHDKFITEEEKGKIVFVKFYLFN